MWVREEDATGFQAGSPEFQELRQDGIAYGFAAEQCYYPLPSRVRMRDWDFGGGRLRNGVS